MLNKINKFKYQEINCTVIEYSENQLNKEFI